MSSLNLEQQFFNEMLPELKEQGADRAVSKASYTALENPWIKTAFGYTALDRLVFKGHLELVEKILAWHKAHAALGVRVGVEKAWLEIQHAPRSHQVQLVRLFCEAGVNPNLSSERLGEKSTLLIGALYAENFELAMALLEQGADPNFKPQNTQSSPWAEFLSQNQKDPRDIELFGALLKAGLDLKIPSKNNIPSKVNGEESALLHLIHFRPRLLPVLLSHGLDPNLKMDDKPLLYWVIEEQRKTAHLHEEGALETLATALLTHGADPCVKVHGKCLDVYNRSLDHPLAAIEVFAEKRALQDTLPTSPNSPSKGLRL